MNILFILIGLVVGLAAPLGFYFARKSKVDKLLFESRETSQKIIEEAHQEAKVLKKTTVLEAKEEWYKVKKKQEDVINDRQRELRSLEQKYNDRLSNLDKRLDILDRKEQNLLNLESKTQEKEKRLNKEKQQIDVLISKQEEELTKIAQMTREEAVESLMDSMREKAKQQAATACKNIIEEAKAGAKKEASSILATAVQRVSVDYVSESTVSVVSLPSDEMKGRIIGREGRNIRSFEKASGVDLIIDDTPEAVVLSCFDSVRREIARIALEKLILDGRIHPGRIEEVIEKTRQEMDENIMQTGEQACMEVNVHNISPNIVKLLGRLQFRTSYGQNVLQHSIEAAWVAGIIAAELGLDQKLARRAGFLHDIGKAIDHEFDGSHASLGANIARKNGESKVIVNAIEAHHEEVEPASVYAAIVQASDAVSGARPGARREMLETYMQRLGKLEEIASTVEGVNKSYAIQAGRELRIIVDPVSVDDSNSVFIANDIAEKIEKEMQYPGQIKVVVIRETRQSALAK